MTHASVAGPLFARVFPIALTVGLIGVAASIFAAFTSPDLFFRAWLFGFQFWMGLSIGCLAILPIQYLTGGAWGVATRRLLEPGAMLTPLMAAMFVPVLLGLPHIYLWAQPERVASDEVLLHKAGYLNPTYFLIRSAVYFVLWTVLSLLFYHGSRQQDKLPDPAPTRRLEALAGPGMALLVASGSFAWMDWLMSLEPHWYSSIFPIMVLAGQALSSMAMIVGIACVIAEDDELAIVLTPPRIHDLGTLLFTFTFFWAYLCYSQLIVIWAGNLKHEITWYLIRIAGGWTFVAAALFALAFVIPFFLLLFRQIKRDRRTLARIALLAFVMQIVNAYWLSAPPFQSEGPEFHWQYVSAFCAVGGIWVAGYAWLIRQRPFMPVYAPGYPNVVSPVDTPAAALAGGE